LNLHDTPPARVVELAALLQRRAPTDGTFATEVPRLSVIRQSFAGDEMTHAVHQPAVCIVAQGAKRVLLRDEVYSYDASRYLVFSADLPVSGHVTEATAAEPYLCFRLDFDPAEVSAMAMAFDDTPSRRPAATARALFTSPATDGMLDAAIRLLCLLDTPDDIGALAPLAMQELVYRLLRGEQGGRLADIARTGTHAHRIAKVIQSLKARFAEPLRIDDLARDVHMSPSSLHHHFRAVTSMSPLQYQKQLRLQEARRLLLSAGADVAAAGHRVGYESPSQFSREYSRLFGVAPSRDALR